MVNNDLIKLIETTAQTNPKKLDGLRFLEYHPNCSADPNYTCKKLRLLPNGKFCIEERSPLDEDNSEKMTLDYGDGHVYLNNPVLEKLDELAFNLFGTSVRRVYKVQDFSGYCPATLARIFLNPNIRIIDEKLLFK